MTTVTYTVILASGRWQKTLSRAILAQALVRAMESDGSAVARLSFSPTDKDTAFEAEMVVVFAEVSDLYADESLNVLSDAEMGRDWILRAVLSFQPEYESMVEVDIS